MKHFKLFENYVNEGSLSKKSGEGEIAVMRADKSKAEKIMSSMELEYEDLGPKDSSRMNYYRLPDTDWDILNKIGDKVDLQSMAVFESANQGLNEGAILKAIKPSLEGDVKEAVEALETLLRSTDAILDYKQAEALAECIIDIIDAAKQEARDEYSD